MNLTLFAGRIHLWNRSQGFYDREWIGKPAPDGTSIAPCQQGWPNPSLVSEKLLLVVSEVVEIQDALRDGDREKEAEEAADVFIRMLDYCAWRDIDIANEISKKIQKNEFRPWLHGRKVF